MTREWVKRHKRVSDLVKNSDKNIITTKEVAEEIGSDRRTVEAHFQVMDIDGRGRIVYGKALITNGAQAEDIAELVREGEYELAERVMEDWGDE